MDVAAVVQRELPQFREAGQERGAAERLCEAVKLIPRCNSHAPQFQELPAWRG